MHFKSKKVMGETTVYKILNGDLRFREIFLGTGVKTNGWINVKLSRLIPLEHLMGQGLNLKLH